MTPAAGTSHARDVFVVSCYFSEIKGKLTVTFFFIRVPFGVIEYLSVLKFRVRNVLKIARRYVLFDN